MRREIIIGGRKVGPGHPVLIIAEAGVNHNGNIEMACRLVDEAVAAGADAVKFQTFKADRLVVPDAPKADYQLRITERAESQLEMLRQLELSPEAHRLLMDYCRERRILFMSTPFDEESADFLEQLGIVVFKIPSGEITNLRFLQHVARKRKPMIVSTGMSTLGEVGDAVAAIAETGNQDLILLHCVSQYPADPADVNLRAMKTMADKFNVPVGYSDHTQGTEVAVAAAAIGACVIEKHLTLGRALPGPDHRASVEPGDLTALVRGIRVVETSLGHGRKEPTDSEADTIIAARKSIVVCRDIQAGSILTEDLLATKRPGTGLPPSALRYLVGRVAARDIPADTILSWEMLI